MLKSVFGHLFVYRGRFFSQFPIVTTRNSGTEKHFLHGRIMLNRISRRFELARATSSFPVLISCTSFFLRIMFANDPPQNVNEDEDNCDDEIADTQQNFQKSRGHKKCNLSTLMCDYVNVHKAIQNVQI